MATLSLKRKPAPISEPSTELTTPTEETKTQRTNAMREMIQELKSKYKVFAMSKPLKIGIHNDLFGTGEYKKRKKLLRTAIKYHCLSPKYLRKMTEKTHRYDLEGNKVELILPEHKKLAQETSKQMHKRIIS